MKSVDKKRRWYMLLVFCMLFFSEDVLFFTTNSDRRWFWVKNFILLLMTIVLFYVQCAQKNNISRMLTATVVILAINIVVTMVTIDDFDNRFVYSMVVIAFSYLFVSCMPKQTFVECYIKCMQVFALVSVVEFGVFLLAYPITLLAPEITNISGFRYSNWILTNSLYKEDYPIYPYRNWGIYREPGVYACFLILALLFELYCTSKTNKKNVALFLLTVVTTFSTSGYIVCALVFMPKVYAWIKKHSKTIKRKNVFLILLGCIIMAGIVFACWDDIYRWVFSKFTQAGGSTGARVGSVFSNLELFLGKPLVGNGWTQVSYEFSEVQSIANTNTLLHMLSVYGVVFFSLVFTGTIKFFEDGKKFDIIEILGMALSWIVITSGEDLALNAIIYILAFYGMQSFAGTKTGASE